MTTPPKKINRYLNLDIPNWLHETRAMTPSARLAYIDLAVYAAQNDGIVPGDLEALRKVARVDRRIWGRVKDEILPVMEACDDGYRIHHAATSSERYRQAVEAGAEGGRSKATANAKLTCNLHAVGNRPKPLKSLDGTLATLEQRTKPNPKEQKQKEIIEVLGKEEVQPGQSDDYPDDIPEEAIRFWQEEDRQDIEEQLSELEGSEVAGNILEPAGTPPEVETTAANGTPAADPETVFDQKLERLRQREKAEWLAAGDRQDE
jgi:hypothetical protein